jgi:hypothetical protein
MVSPDAERQLRMLNNSRVNRDPRQALGQLGVLTIVSER